MFTSLKRITSQNTILKNFSVLTLSNTLSQFLFIFTSIKVARSLSPVAFGSYNLLQLHISIFSVIACFGLRNIIIRSIARNRSLIKNIFFTGLVIRFATLVLTILLYFVYYFIYRQYDNLLFVLVIVSIVSTVLFDLFESVAFGIEKMEFSGIINFISTLCWLLTILLIPEEQLTLKLIFGLFVFFSTLKTLVYFFSIYKADYVKGFTKLNIERKEIFDFTKESFPYYYLALFTLLSNQIPLLFLEYRSGVAEIGYFNIASKVLMPINLVLLTALAAIFPNLSRLFISNYTLFIRNVKIIFTLVTIFGMVGAFGVTFFRSEVIFLLYGEKYMDSSLVLGYQIWYVAIYSVVCLIGTIMGAINRQKELSYLSTVCTIIQVPILWYGSKFGAEYLSAAFLVATTILLIIHIYVINTYLKKDISLFFYVKIMALFVIGYVVSLLTPEGLNFFYKAIIFIMISVLGGYFLFSKYKNDLKKIFAK